MLLKVGHSVNHGFDSPIGLLGDCHRRVEAYLGILVTVTRNWRGQPLPASDLAALEQAHGSLSVEEAAALSAERALSAADGPALAAWALGASARRTGRRKPAAAGRTT